MTDTSNHDHHDLDLIAAHADGEISSRAEALLASCTECRVEYDLQKQVRLWLAAAPTVAMADHERAALHHRVSEQITRSTVVGIGERRSGRQPGLLLLRLGAVAAGLAVLVGVSGVLGRLGAGGGAAGTATTAAVAESMMASGEDGDLNDAAGAGAPADTTAGMLAAEAAPQSRALPGGDAEAVREEAQMLIDETGVGQSTDEGVAAPPCVDEIDGRTPLRWAESLLDGEPIVIVIVEGEENPEALVYRLDGCELVDF